MLEPQSTELPHETEYFLDCATEAMKLDAGSRIVLVIYGDRARIGGIVDGQHPIPADDGVLYPSQLANWAMRQTMKSRHLAAYAGELLAQLSPLHQAGATYLSVNHLLHGVRDHAWCFGYWAITDSCEGGALEPMNKRKYSGWRWSFGADQCAGITPKAARRLGSRSWIRRYVHQRDESMLMRILLLHVMQRGCPPDVLSRSDEAATIFDRDYAEHRRRYDAASRRSMAALLLRADFTVKTDTPKAARKVAKRSAMFAASLLGPKMVNEFISGFPVQIEGENAVLEVAKRGTILRGRGHGSMEVAVLDKDRHKLADLCVYHEDMPVLDQLAGFALAMQAGEERDILATANITKLTAAGAIHPLLAGRKRHESQIVIDPVRRRNDEYWHRTKEAWIEETGIFVFGRAWKALANGKATRAR